MTTPSSATITPERQQSIHPRRRQAGLGRDFTRDLDRAGQGDGIDHKPPGAFLRLDGEGNLKRAALKAFAGEAPAGASSPS